MNKKYGKLTEDQFKRVIRKLPGFREESRDLRERMIWGRSPVDLRSIYPRNV